MSSTFTLIGRENVLSANYFPPVELNSNQQYALGLIGFYTFNSVLNVDASNNRFVYLHTLTGESCTIVIPPGNYEIDTLGEYIQQQMIEGGKEVDVDDVFCLRANNSSLCCEVKSSHDIDFTAANTPARMLGFTPNVYKRNTRHQSDLSVEILKHRIVRVECNIVTGAYLNSEEAHTLYEFDVDVEPGYKISQEPKNIIYMPIKQRDFISNITLRVVDEKGLPIDFRGEQIIVRVELKQL